MKKSALRILIGTFMAISMLLVNVACGNNAGGGGSGGSSGGNSGGGGNGGGGSGGGNGGGGGVQISTGNLAGTTWLYDEYDSGSDQEAEPSTGTNPSNPGTPGTPGTDETPIKGERQYVSTNSTSKNYNKPYVYFNSEAYAYFGYASWTDEVDEKKYSVQYTYPSGKPGYTSYEYEYETRTSGEKTFTPKYRGTYNVSGSKVVFDFTKTVLSFYDYTNNSSVDFWGDGYGYASTGKTSEDAAPKTQNYGLYSDSNASSKGTYSYNQGSNLVFKMIEKKNYPSNSYYAGQQYNSWTTWTWKKIDHNEEMLGPSYETGVEKKLYDTYFVYKDDDGYKCYYLNKDGSADLAEVVKNEYSTEDYKDYYLFVKKHSLVPSGATESYTTYSTSNGKLYIVINYKNSSSYTNTIKEFTVDSAASELTCSADFVVCTKTDKVYGLTADNFGSLKSYPELKKIDDLVGKKDWQKEYEWCFQNANFEEENYNVQLAYVQEKYKLNIDGTIYTVNNILPGAFIAEKDSAKYAWTVETVDKETRNISISDGSKTYYLAYKERSTYSEEIDANEKLKISHIYLSAKENTFLDANQYAKIDETNKTVTFSVKNSVTDDDLKKVYIAFALNHNEANLYYKAKNQENTEYEDKFNVSQQYSSSSSGGSGGYDPYDPSIPTTPPPGFDPSDPSTWPAGSDPNDPSTWPEEWFSSDPSHNSSVVMSRSVLGTSGPVYEYEDPKYLDCSSTAEPKPVLIVKVSIGSNNYSKNYDVKVVKVADNAETKKITYNVNNKLSSETITDGSYVPAIGTKINTKPANIGGFEFIGWNTKSDGKGAWVSTISGGVYTGDLTLYAIWKGKPVEYKVNRIFFGRNIGVAEGEDGATKMIGYAGTKPDIAKLALSGWSVVEPGAEVAGVVYAEGQTDAGKTIKAPAFDDIKGDGTSEYMVFYVSKKLTINFNTKKFDASIYGGDGEVDVEVTIPDYAKSNNFTGTPSKINCQVYNGSVSYKYEYTGSSANYAYKDFELYSTSQPENNKSGFSITAVNWMVDENSFFDNEMSEDGVTYYQLITLNDFVLKRADTKEQLEMGFVIDSNDSGKIKGFFVSEDWQKNYLMPSPSHDGKTYQISSRPVTP